MTEQIVCALVTGSILAMLFSNTRTVGIICIAVLTFLFPIPMVIIVLFGVGVYLYKKVFSK